MFSPLNIVIKPSRFRRWLSLFIHLLVLASLLYIDLPLFGLLIIAVVILVSAVFDLLKKQDQYALHWNVSQGSVAVSIYNQTLIPCIKIQRLHLLFGLLFIHLKFEERADLKLYIFKDSVDAQSYRRLRVAARWANLKIRPLE